MADDMRVLVSVIWNQLDHIWAWLGVRSARRRTLATTLLLCSALGGTLTELPVFGRPVVAALQIALSVLLCVLVVRKARALNCDGRRFSGYAGILSAASQWLDSRWLALGLTEARIRRVLNLWVALAALLTLADGYLEVLFNPPWRVRAAETSIMVVALSVSIGLCLALLPGAARRALVGYGVASVGIACALLIVSDRNQLGGMAWVGSALLLTGVLALAGDKQRPARRTRKRG